MPVCHCRSHEDCHVDVIIETFREELLNQYPEYDIPDDAAIREGAERRREEKGWIQQPLSGPSYSGPAPLSVRRSSGQVAVVDGGGPILGLYCRDY